MQAFLIFLAAALILVVLGYFFPTKSHKTPQNDRETRQGSTTQWLEEINSTRGEKR
jgi:protein involved in temperature-dependent protein secretion